MKIIVNKTEKELTAIGKMMLNGLRTSWEDMALYTMMRKQKHSP